MERCPISFESGQKEAKQQYESLILSVNESYFYLIDFLNVLYNFAVSDEIKYEIYETYGMKTNLSVFILNGNSIEKDYSLKLLMQLCYDKRVADLLLKQSIDIVDFVGDLVKNRNQVENKSLIRNGNGLLFVLNKGKTKRDTEQLNDSSKVIQSTEKDSTNEGHIMISYNSKSRPLCMSIKVGFLSGLLHKYRAEIENRFSIFLHFLYKTYIEKSCLSKAVYRKPSLSIPSGKAFFSLPSNFQSLLLYSNNLYQKKCLASGILSEGLRYLWLKNLKNDFYTFLYEYLSKKYLFILDLFF